MAVGGPGPGHRVIVGRVEPVIAAGGVGPGGPRQKVILILSLNSGERGPVTLQLRAPRRPAGEGRAGLVGRPVDGSVAGLPRLELGAVVLVADVQSFAVDEGFATLGPLWLQLLLVVHSLESVEKVGVDHLLLGGGRLGALKCFSVECEEFFVCFSTRHLEILLGHDQGFVDAGDWDQEETSFALKTSQCSLTNIGV